MGDMTNGGTDGFARIRLALRSDLAFSEHEEPGGASHVIFDPVRTQYYRIGEAEGRFARLLDGKRSIRDAADEAARIEGDGALDLQAYLTLAHWLLETGLATTRDVRLRAEAVKNSRLAEDSHKIIQRLNLIFIRIPLCNPDRVLKAVAPYFAWCFSRLAFFGWLAFCGLAVLVVASHPYKVARSTDGIFAGSSWLLIGLAWILLKLLHEAAHGIALAHYGKSVREFGLLFILFLPIGYTDASSAWRLPSKWERIIVASAGMYSEVFIAAAASLIWWVSKDETIVFVAFKVMLTAGVSTVFFNMNPLMRFDGYYILSDLAGAPNLYTNGVLFCSYLIRKYLLGLDVPLPIALQRGRCGFVRVYGVCTFFWRLCVVATLLVSASIMVPGIGPLIAMGAAMVWFTPGILRFCSSLKGVGMFRLLRGAVLATLLSGSAWFGLKHLAWPGFVSSPGYVEYGSVQPVRPRTSGFIRTIYARSGDRVSKGDPLVKLENRELEAELRNVELDLQIVELRSRIYYHHGELAASQVEESNASALRKRKIDLQKDVAALRITAGMDGRVVAPDLESREGSYVTPSDELLTIVDNEHKEVHFSIAQEDVEQARTRQGESARILVKGVTPRRLYGRIARIEPEAALSIPHLALSSLGGGPLPVRRGQVRRSSTLHPTGYQLLSPRFTGVLVLGEDESAGLLAGQVCKVSIRSQAQSISDRVEIHLRRWLKRKTARRR